MESRPTPSPAISNLGRSSLSNSDIVKWILGAMLTVLLAVGGFVVKGIAADQVAAEAERQELEVQVAVQQYQVNTLLSEVIETNVRLETLESKLDEVLAK